MHVTAKVNIQRRGPLRNTLALKMKGLKLEEFSPRPHLLSSPNIPKPLHGLNPRTIMGREKWDIERRKVYETTDHRCAACGVHKSQTRKHKWMEAHEIFEIDYANGVANLKEIVPLCHFCHSFIHSGLLRVMARKRKVTANHVREVLRHGCNLLVQGNYCMFVGTADLCDITGVDRFDIPVMRVPKKIAAWGDWKMVWGGVEYPAKYTSQEQWKRAYK